MRLATSPTLSCSADLAKPIDAVFDALHESLEDHADDSEEYHNLLLTLGSVGRHLPSGHPQQERTRETLERRLDEMVAENQVTERQWAQDMDAARTVIDATPESEWHTWCVASMLGPVRLPWVQRAHSTVSLRSWCPCHRYQAGLHASHQPPSVA